MTGAQRPVGWWLKEADARLDAAFDGALAGSGTDRRGWQVLTSLARGPLPRADLVASLAAFDTPDAVAAVVDELRAREWVLEADGLLRLAPEGEAQRTVLAARVDAVRDRVAAALGEDYPVLVELLARLVDGLADRR